MGEIPSPYITKVIVRATELNNENVYVLQIGTASLLQIRASVITNWGSYYKLGQTYYKRGQLLQIGPGITN